MRLVNRLSTFVGWAIVALGGREARVIFDSAPVWVSIEISGTQSDWKIEHISWDY